MTPEIDYRKKVIEIEEKKLLHSKKMIQALDEIQIAKDQGIDLTQEQEEILEEIIDEANRGGLTDTWKMSLILAAQHEDGITMEQLVKSSGKRRRDIYPILIDRFKFNIIDGKPVSTLSENDFYKLLEEYQAI